MVNIEQEDGLLRISYINKNGDLDIMGIPIPDEEAFKWVYAERSGSKKFISWDGKGVKKQKTKFLTNHRITEFLLSQPKEVQDTLFSNELPNMFFIDIETEILDEFPSPDNPKAKILTISIADQKGNITVLGLKDLEQKSIRKIDQKINEYVKDFGETWNFNYIKYKTEFDLLYTFLKKFVNPMPFITGWNFTGFDWPYITERSRRLGIDVGICSPTGVLHGVELPYTDQKKINNKLPLHKIVVDYLQVYKKWDNIIPTKESDTLDYVAEQALNVKKIHYSGTLTELYRDNFPKFVYYNAIDSILVKLIHDKLNSVMPYLTLANLTRVDHHRVYSSMAMIENILCMQLLKYNKVLIKEEKEEVHKNKYQGAFVFPVTPGFHNWLLTLDYASLYPTTIRQHKISPEKFLGKIDKIPKELDGDVIYCASGATFKKDEDGALPILMTEIYKDRKKAKKTYISIDAEIQELRKILKQKINKRIYDRTRM